MMERYGVPFNEQDYEQFQAVNKPLWVAYQNKEITAQDLQRIRFEKIAQQTGQEPLALNHELMAEMALLSQPLENVREMLDSLFGKVKMAIITNGFQALQQKRLENTRLNKYFDVVVVSETVGAAKPAPQIFESAFAQMRHVDKHAILMVGDTLSSDVQGGINVGIDTCWFNPTKQPNSTTIQPTYEIAEILDLVKIVSG